MVNERKTSEIEVELTGFPAYVVDRFFEAIGKNGIGKNGILRICSDCTKKS